MKFLFLFLLAGSNLFFTEWHPDFASAQKQANANGKYILLNFSGSDWCAPCIKLRQEVFGRKEFEQIANNSLELYDADFPRKKKNQLSKELQESNDSLAEKYNPLGKFPYTVVLTPEGKVVKAWEGYPDNNSTLFIEQLKSVCDVKRPR
jgi:thioredoxin-related protein